MLFIKMLLVPFLTVLCTAFQANGYKWEAETLGWTYIFLMFWGLPAYFVILPVYTPLEIILRRMRKEQFMIVFAPVLGVVIAGLLDPLPISNLNANNFPSFAFSGFIWSFFSLISYFFVLLNRVAGRAKNAAQIQCQRPKKFDLTV